MKFSITPLFLIFNLLLLTSSCDSFETSLSKPTLPSATKQGKNTFGCVLEGRNTTDYSGENMVIVPRGLDGISPIFKGYYQDGNLNIETWYEDEHSGGKYYISLHAANMPLNMGNIYPIVNSDNEKIHATITCTSKEDNLSSFSSKNIIGELTITHSDKLNLILSGTFWFDAIDSHGYKIKVREGRFDMKYPIIY